MTDDIRKGLPSASGASRWGLCKGSHLAERDIPDDPSTDSILGDVVHAAIEEWLREYGRDAIIPYPTMKDGLTAEDGTPLDEETIDLIARMLKIRNKIIQDVFPTVSEFSEVGIEERLWIHDPQTFDPVCSAQLDYRATSDHKHLIIDWKSGRGLVEPAQGNPQLRTQAACLSQESPDADEIVVAIVQPWAVGFEKGYTIARYSSPEEIRLAEIVTIAEARAAMQPNQPRVPGLAQCKWCKAKDNCPEAQVLTALIPAGDNPLDRPVTGEELDLYKMAEKIIKARKDKARAQLEADPESIKGYELRKGRRSVSVNSLAAWSKVGINIGGAAFAEACKVSIPQLSEKVAAHQGIAKAKARRDVEAILADDLDESFGAKVLTAVGG